MNEMPNCPHVAHCHCYPEEEKEANARGTTHCVCGESEKALRGWCNWRMKEKMTPEQREWCLQEIDQVEGYERKNYETCPDDLLANGVLCAWLDYARDKGME